MAWFHKIKAGLVKFPVDEWIGPEGTLFYNRDDATLRLGDGVTPGGIRLFGAIKDLYGGDADSQTIVDGIVNDSILVFNAAEKKFVAEDFREFVDRIKIDLETQYDRLVDVDGVYTYVGEATPGTNKSDATWRIKRIEEIGDDLEILWANGSAEFDKTWDSRSTYTF